MGSLGAIHTVCFGGPHPLENVLAKMLPVVENSENMAHHQIAKIDNLLKLVYHFPHGLATTHPFTAKMLEERGVPMRIAEHAQEIYDLFPCNPIRADNVTTGRQAVNVLQKMVWLTNVHADVSVGIVVNRSGVRRGYHTTTITEYAIIGGESLLTAYDIEY